MSQLNVDSIKDRTGASQPDIVGVAKAFVNFDGTGTVAIRSGFNVSSITDLGTGAYGVNFTNDMPDANYAVSGIAVRTASIYGAVLEVRGGSFTVSSVDVNTRKSTDGAVFDNEFICVTVHSN